MRKSDYSHLAKVINRHAQNMRRAKEHATDAQTLHACSHALATLEIIAHDFARSASVDRAEFINQCGV